MAAEPTTEQRVPVEVPGRRHTTASHTIGVEHLIALLGLVPEPASAVEYASAVVDDNVLGRPTHAGRHRTMRHLRELYLLDPQRPAFRALRRLWSHDRAAGPQLAGLLAYCHDELLRASFPPVAQALIGAAVDSTQLAQSVRSQFGHTLNAASLARVGRNAAASWTQTGHLGDRTAKRRTTMVPRPAATAFALYLGHLEGARGAFVLDSRWTAWFGVTRDQVEDSIDEAVRLGFADLRRAGGMTDVGFRLLNADGSRP